MRSKELPNGFEPRGVGPHRKAGAPTKTAKFYANQQKPIGIIETFRRWLRAKELERKRLALTWEDILPLLRITDDLAYADFMKNLHGRYAGRTGPSDDKVDTSIGLSLREAADQLKHMEIPGDWCETALAQNDHFVGGDPDTVQTIHLSSSDVSGFMGSNTDVYVLRRREDNFCIVTASAYYFTD
jgi:hypothetical protein